MDDAKQSIFPHSLNCELETQINEDCEIFYTYSPDADEHVWYCVPSDLKDEKWIIIINYAEHMGDNYQMVNITGKATDRLRKVIDELLREQTDKPVAWQFYQDGRWWMGDDSIPNHRQNTEEAGFLTRDLYAGK